MMKRETERKIKNVIVYLLSIAVIVAAIYLKYYEKVGDGPFVLLVVIGFFGMAESDITDLVEMFLKHGGGFLK